MKKTIIFVLVMGLIICALSAGIYFFKPNIERNETRTLKTFEAILKAAKDYEKNNKSYALNIGQLIEQKYLLNSRRNRLIQHYRPVGGYYFSYASSGNHFKLMATPLLEGVTGTKVFSIDSDNLSNYTFEVTVLEKGNLIHDVRALGKERIYQFQESKVFMAVQEVMRNAQKDLYTKGSGTKSVSGYSYFFIDFMPNPSDKTLNAKLYVLVEKINENQTRVKIMVFNDANSDLLYARFFKEIENILKTRNNTKKEE